MINQHHAAAALRPWDAADIKQPHWGHVFAAFVAGAKEARANPDADEYIFGRAADAHTKRVLEEIDPASEHALRTGTWSVETAAAAPHGDLDAGLALTIDQRDTAEGWADGLAALIGKYFGRDIGEHSSAHCPWQEAKEIIAEAEPYQPAAVARPARRHVGYWLHHPEISPKGYLLQSVAGLTKDAQALGWDYEMVFADAPALEAPAAPADSTLRSALERAHAWMDGQADAQSKGGHATFDMMMLREERDAIAAALAAAPQAPAAPAAFQQRVQPWLMECFGPVISADKQERNHRFLEEALETVQAAGCTASEAHQLVDYVFGRPVGELGQEVGGAMTTLAALCLANGIDMHAEADKELARVWTMVEKIRAKQAAKPKHSPLPAAPAAPAVDASDTALLDAMERERIAVIPEFEGPWDAQIFGEDESTLACGSGATPRKAIAEALVSLEARKAHDAAQAKEGGAPVADAAPLDVCTDPYNCARCKTHPAHRGDMHHAGISRIGGSA